MKSGRSTFFALQNYTPFHAGGISLSGDKIYIIICGYYNMKYRYLQKVILLLFKKVLVSEMVTFNLQVSLFAVFYLCRLMIYHFMLLMLSTS